MTNNVRPSTAGPVRRQRNRALATIDIVVGIVLLLVGAYNLFTQLALQFAAPNEGLGVPLKVLSVISWAIGLIGFGFFVSRRRVAFYWPIIGLALLYGSLLLFIAIAQANR
jgi:drug/metabolite transporter (DMT)-like permease